MKQSLDHRIETDHGSWGIQSFLLVFCAIDLIIGVYRPVLRTGIPGISELNIVIYILFFISIHRVVIKGNKISIHSHDYIILVYAFYCFIMFLYSCIFCGFNYLEEFIGLKNYLNPFILYFLFKNAIDNTKQARGLITVLIVVLVLSSVISLVGYFLWPDFFLKKSALKSIINQPNLSGMFIITLFPFLFLAFSSKKVITRVIITISIVVVFITLIQTGSRGALLGLCCAFGLAVFEKRIKFKNIIATLLIFFGVFVVMQSGFFESTGVFERIEKHQDVNLSTYSSGRWDAWKGLVKSCVEKPLFGHGFNSFTRVYAENAWGRRLATHNEYLNILFCLGLTGFLIYGLIYYKIWILLRRHNDLLISQACRYGLTGFLVHITFSNPFTVRYIVWLTIAIALRYIQLELKAEETEIVRV